MKTNSSIARTVNPNTRASHFRAVCAARLLSLLLLLTLPAVVQAQFNYTTNNSAITITGYTGSGGDVTIPSSILVNGVSLPVTSIGNYAFLCASMTSVTIPNSVTTISDYAFNYCISVTNVTIGNGVSSIGRAAFASCWSLTSVTIGNSVTSIGDYAVFDCSGLTSIYFKGDAPGIGSYVFDGDNNATIYYLPETKGWEDFAQLTGLPIALWTPRVQTSDGSFGVQANQFGFNINWTSGQIVVVEACTDLANPIWSPVQTNTLAGDSCYFSDPDWTNYPGRFYRLRSP
jgi:hypothetical protein